ncbi:MAG: hypothetical protein IPO13_08295 [Rhodocyclaceae bacterium]|nr:hypothetical protein [Rhodocyclaceae bacterium]
MSKNRTGSVLALAAASLFASGVIVAPIASAADAPTVKCVGATKAATEKTCTDAGGKVAKA